MARRKIPAEIDIRDRRIPASADGTGKGRLCIRHGASTTAEYATRLAAVHRLLELGEWGIVDRLRDRRDTLDIGEVARVLANPARELSDLRPNVRHGGQVTLGDAAKRLLAQVAATMSAGTLRAYKVHLRRLEREFTPDREIGTITSDDLRAFVYNPRGGKVMAPATQALSKAICSRLWRVEIAREREAAEREERRPRLTLNPWSQVEVADVKKTRPYFLTPQQWAAVRDATRGTPSCAFLAVGCLAGLRQQEAAHLRMDIDVDLGVRLLRVQERKGEHAWTAKRPGSVRDVPMSAELRMLLEEHIAAGYAGERFLFRGRGMDRPISTTTAERWTCAGFEAAGVRYGRQAESLTYHNLRHTFASWMVQGIRVVGADGKAMVLAVDVLRVAKLLGDSVKEVIATYGHLMPENLADAVAMIDRKLGREDEVETGAPDEMAAMRDEIARLRDELEKARAA